MLDQSREPVHTYQYFKRVDSKIHSNIVDLQMHVCIIYVCSGGAAVLHHKSVMS